MRKPKIADFSTHFPGPIATHLLVGLGADVVKFENPRTGDGNRELPPQVHGEGLWHAFLNSGTRSVAIDRHSSMWPEVVSAATRWADAVIVSDRIPVLERRGLDFKTLSQANNQIVYCMLPGYGNRGEWSGWSAHGQNVDAMAGNLQIERDANGWPIVAPTWRGPSTTATGLFAALAVMNGLYQREPDDPPLCIEVSMWASAVWWNWRDFLHEANVGYRWHGGIEDHGSRYAIYHAGDAKLIMVCPIEQKFWTSFVDLLGLPQELLSRGKWDTTRMDFGVGPEYDEEREQIQQILERQPLTHWLETLGSAGIPVAAVMSLGEVMASPHSKAEGLAATVKGRQSGESFIVPRIPIRICDDAVPGDMPKRISCRRLRCWVKIRKRFCVCSDFTGRPVKCSTDLHTEFQGEC